VIQFTPPLGITRSFHNPHLLGLGFNPHLQNQVFATLQLFQTGHLTHTNPFGFVGYFWVAFADVALGPTCRAVVSALRYPSLSILHPGGLLLPAPTASLFGRGAPRHTAESIEWLRDRGIVDLQ
jgi:hypothetical protein